MLSHLERLITDHLQNSLAPYGYSLKCRMVGFFDFNRVAQSQCARILQILATNASVLEMT